MKNTAVVRPGNVVAEMSVDNVMQEIEGTDLVTHDFDGPEEAADWLRSR